MMATEFSYEEVSRIGFDEETLKELDLIKIKWAIGSCDKTTKALTKCVEILAGLDDRGDAEWVIDTIHRSWHKNKEEQCE